MDLSLIPRAFLLAALAFTDSALAAAQAPLDPQEQEQIQDGLSGPELKESPPPVKEQRQAPIRERLLDEPHDFLSRRVEAYSRKLDNFLDRKSTRLNSSHLVISYAVFCLKKKKKKTKRKRFRRMSP